MSLNSLLKSNTPFAIVMYFEWVKFAPQSKNKIYELLLIKKGVLKTKKLEYLEVEEFKEIHEQLTMVQNTNDGRAWEYLNFKKTLTKLNYKKNLVETY